VIILQVLAGLAFTLLCSGLFLLVLLVVLRNRTPVKLKQFACWITWHSFPVGYETTGFDGCSTHARCRWCGYEGMVDSQGGLF
jgi:hypothetical protein